MKSILSLLALFCLTIGIGLAQVNPSGSSGTAVNINQVGGNSTVTGGVNGSFGVGGLAAVGATAAGNPVYVGGVFNTTPGTITNGQAGALQLDATQNLLTKINVALPAGSNVIGHVIMDSGSTTVVTGTVAATQSGTWTAGMSAGTALIGTVLPKTQCGTTQYNPAPTNLPNTLTSLTSTDTCIEAVICNNIDSGAAHPLTITDNSTNCNGGTCNLVSPAFSLAALYTARFPLDYAKATGGIKWNTDSANKVTCYVVGVQ